VPVPGVFGRKLRPFVKHETLSSVIQDFIIFVHVLEEQQGRVVEDLRIEASSTGEIGNEDDLSH
jgi:hypothetical protein